MTGDLRYRLERFLPVRRATRLVSVQAMLIGVAAFVGLIVTSCKSGDPSDRSDVSTTGSTSTTTTTGKRRVDGAATFTELTAGSMVPPLSVQAGPDLAASGYRQVEYAASGTATRYRSADELAGDGDFEFTPGESSPFSTRVLVKRPGSADRFNGTVVVEWLNVSSGSDAAPDYTYLADELVRSGYAYVGVSAQYIGVEGGPVSVEISANPIAGKGLRTLDPERYGTLDHPGDAYSYDIFTKVAEGIRSADGPLSGLDVKTVIAAGESQSAEALTTYYDGVQPLVHEFDGFLIHSRAGAPLPLGEGGRGIAATGTLAAEPVKLRTDIGTPVMVVQTETDVAGPLDSLRARQGDSDTYRLWEVAGTAHVDLVQIGPVEPTLRCLVPINRGQQEFVVRAALAALNTWATTGSAPTKAARLEVRGHGDRAEYVTDDDGNVRGGVRTPVVDAPVDRLSGIAPEGSSLACMLAGSTTPLSAERLAARYSSREQYLSEYRAATDRAIRAGVMLEADRREIEDGAQPDRIAG
ncbi:MAG: alpha/beta hydrolase domain-containing protein [Microthrixaceae bacterium]